jgi:hypothetical protein
MTKTAIFSVALASFLFSCSNDTSTTVENDQKTEQTQDELGSGPEFEATILQFDMDNQKTELELINRGNEAIQSISGRLVFLNEDGSPLTRANGDPITSPFQQTSNPHVVGAKSKTTIVLRNSIQKGTSKLSLAEVKVKTTSGEEIEVSQ